MGKTGDLEICFNKWYRGLRGLKQYQNKPAKGAIAAALIVLERLRNECDLSFNAHLAAGGAQIAGLNLPSLRRILGRFGESRKFPSEGGRTNRGNNRVVRNLLEALEKGGVGEMSSDERNKHIDEMQHFLVESLDVYYQQEGIGFRYDASRLVNRMISDILAKADERNQVGAVAQHLVGAKLALRFSKCEIKNFPASAADGQAGRKGDFFVGDTAFHVTVAPMQTTARRCAENLREGLRSAMVVPSRKVVHAKAHLENESLEDRVVVYSLEDFVSQNIDELGGFRASGIEHTFGDVLREYNRRVKEVETDMSLLIKIPAGVGREE